MASSSAVAVVPDQATSLGGTGVGSSMTIDQ
jgi:hypothetical protein